MTIATRPPVQRQSRRPAVPDRTTEYAHDVVAGRIVAGRLVHLACERHLRDLKRKDLRWDRAEAERSIDFFPLLLRHYKGEWDGQPVELNGWQCFIVGSLFGWYVGARRRFRKAFTEVGKKNGKTVLCAGVGLRRAFFDKEAGAEVYSAATKRDQARLVWNDAREMVRRSSALRARIRVFVSSLSDPGTASVFRPLGADTDSEDGLNPSTVLVDEVHRHKDRQLIDWAAQSFGARLSPLLWQITTAGEEGESVWNDEHEYAERVLERTVEDDALFAYVANLDDGDDPFDESVWIKANPNLGVSVSWEDMRQAALEAREKPSTLPTFLRLRLNVRSKATAAAFTMDRWDVCAKPIRAQAGAVCYGGLDLASVRDLTAFVLVFPQEDGEIDWMVRLWAPEEGVRERSQRDRAPYERWVEMGLLKVTQGGMTDFDVVREDIRELSREYQIEEIGFDPWNATQLATQLSHDGATMVSIPQGYAHLSAPSRLLEDLVAIGKLRHGGNRALRWMAGNLVWETDGAGNIRPSKKKSRERIDALAAGIMGISRYVAHLQPGPSVYEERGLVTF
jgi:phage terminase large subunit-like protein